MEIVHVTGHSCAGKRTLIKQLIQTKHDTLRSHFGIHGSTAMFFNACEKDRAYDDPPWRAISELSTFNADHLLHKWQFATQNHSLKLASVRPNVSHRAVALWRSCDEMIDQIKRKGWWDPSLGEMRREMRKFLEHMDELQAAGINVEYFDAGKADYPRLQRVSLESRL